MVVNSSVLGDVSNELTSKLNNPKDGAFYSLNYAELIALDRERVKSAIKRLRRAEPIRMRKDITVRLVGLMGEQQDLETYGDLAEALDVWSVEGDGADQIVAGIGKKLRERGQRIPAGILRFLAKRKTPSAATMIVEVWAEQPSIRKPYVEQYGSSIANLITPFLRSSEPSLAMSAASILGNIGTRKELPDMREALTGATDEEFRVTLQEAIERVARR